MARSDIERKIYNAFSKGVPDVLDSVLAECLERKGQGIEMTENKTKRRPALKIAAIAAAVVLILAMSVTAAAFSGVVDIEEVFGFTGKDEAFGIAATYVVKHSESELESSDLAIFILSGMTYDISSENSEVTLGLSGLRPVYRVKFKVGGYAFEVVVDAKTGAVLSCEKEVDEGWEEHLKDEISPDNSTDGTEQTPEQTWSGYYRLKFTDKPNPDAVMGDIDTIDALFIAEDWFGLDFAGHFYGCNDGVYSNNIGEGDYDGESFKYFVQLVHGGYIYEAKVDSVSGEVIESYVIEYPEYDGDKHTHTRNEEYIGEYHAYLIAEGLAEGLFGELHGYVTTTFFSAGSVLVGTENNTTDVYMAWFGKRDSNTQVTVFVDARTGDIIYYDVVDTE